MNTACNEGMQPVSLRLRPLFTHLHATPNSMQQSLHFICIPSGNLDI